MTREFTKKELQIIKAYKHYIDSPMSDGYTRVYLEGKFNMTIEEMSKLYEEHKKDNYKNLTKEQAYDLIRKEIKTYFEKEQFGCCCKFPKDEIIDIVYAVKE